MNYIKLFEDFTHKMFLLDNKDLNKKIPKTLSVSFDKTNMVYELNSKIPSDTKIEIYYNKPEDFENDMYDSAPPDFLMIRLLLKSESIDYGYLNTKKVIYFEITDRNSPYINIKIDEDGTCNNIIDNKIELSNKTKNDIVKLIKSFGVNINSKDI